MGLRLKNVILNFNDGVDESKFAALRAIVIDPAKVEELFTSYGYSLDNIPGQFARTFSMNATEYEEVRKNLIKIEEKGMKDIFENNLKLMYFKNKFMDRLEQCLEKGLPYLNQDNTFAKFLSDEESFKAFLAQATVQQETFTEPVSTPVATNNTPSEDYNNPTLEEKLNSMSPEDRQLYNEIVEILNYLVLGNLSDNTLAVVVKNATIKIIDAILRKEQTWLEPKEMVESVMFDGLEILDSEKSRIKDLVLGAFPNEERKVA